MSKNKHENNPFSSFILVALKIKRENGYLLRNTAILRSLNATPELFVKCKKPRHYPGFLNAFLM